MESIPDKTLKDILLQNNITDDDINGTGKNGRVLKSDRMKIYQKLNKNTKKSEPDHPLIKDVRHNIYLKLNIDTLENVCYTDKMAQEICLSPNFWHFYFKENGVNPISNKYTTVKSWIKAYKYEKFNQIHKPLLTIHSTFIAIMPLNYVTMHLKILEEAQISFKSVDYYMKYGAVVGYLFNMRIRKNQTIKFTGSYNVYNNGLCSISYFRPGIDGFSTSASVPISVYEKLILTTPWVIDINNTTYNDKNLNKK